MNRRPWETIPICVCVCVWGGGGGGGGGGVTWTSNLKTNVLYHLKFELSRPDVFYLFKTIPVHWQWHFIFDWWWMDVLKKSQFFVTKMSHSRGFQPRTLGFMPNDVPFEVHFDLSSCQTELRVPRTQCHKGQDLWFCNQLLVNQFCTSYWYRYLKIRSLFCIWFGNNFIVFRVKVRTNSIIRTRIM